MKFSKEQKEIIELSKNYHANKHGELIDKYLSGYLTESDVYTYLSDLETVTIKIQRIKEQVKRKSNRDKYKEVVTSNDEDFFKIKMKEFKARKALLEEELDRINALESDTTELRKSKVIQRNKITQKLEFTKSVITKFYEAFNEATKKETKKRGRPKNENKANVAIEEDPDFEEGLEDDLEEIK